MSRVHYFFLLDVRICICSDLEYGSCTHGCNKIVASVNGRLDSFFVNGATVYLSRPHPETTDINIFVIGNGSRLDVIGIFTLQGVTMDVKSPLKVNKRDAAGRDVCIHLPNHHVWVQVSMMSHCKRKCHQL